jgi:hypothetical protein
MTGMKYVQCQKGGGDMFVSGDLGDCKYMYIHQP